MRYIDRIRWQCRLGAGNPALAVPGDSGESVTYGRLASYLDNARRRLRERGARPRAVYGLLVGDALLHIVLMLALEDIGAATVTLSDPETAETWPLAGILSDRDIVKSAFPVWRAHPNWLHMGGEEPQSGTAAYSDDDICRVILTSGSTGKPKGIAYSHRMLAERISRFDVVFGSEFPRHKSTLSCMGLGSGWGYRLCLYQLARGGLFALPEPSIEGTIAKISKYGIENLVASPATLVEFLASPHANRDKLQSLRMILSTGSLLPAALARTVKQRMCPNIVNVYGSSETGTIATAPVDMLNLDKGEVGFVIPGMQIEIVDTDTGAPIKDGAGKIRVKCEANARFYFGAQDGPSPAFQEDIFLSADLGQVSPDGLLSIRGRDNNVVNLGGAKTTLELMEAKYFSAPGVGDVAVVLCRDASGIDRAVAVVAPGEKWSEAAFWSYCHGHVSREFWPVRVVTVDRIPRGQGGKVDRPAVRALV